MTAEPAHRKAKPKKKHGCLTALAVFFAIILALYLFLEFAVPARISTLIEDQMQTELGLDERPIVKVSMHPLAYKLIVGRIDSIYIKATSVQADEGIKAETLEATVKGIKFNTLRVLQTRQPIVDKIDDGEIKAVLSEAAVNDLFGAQLPGSRVKLGKGKLTYSGELPYLLPGFTYTISGTVRVLPDNIISFKPVPEDIAGLMVAQEVKDYLGDTLEVDYAVHEVPDGIVLTGIGIEPGKMTVKASIISIQTVIQGAAGGI